MDSEQHYNRTIKLADGEEIYIQRSSERDSSRFSGEDNLNIPNNHVSKKHACIRIRDGIVCIKDCDSTFGTVVQNEFIMPHIWHRVYPGDSIGLVVSKPSHKIIQVVKQYPNATSIPLSEFNDADTRVNITYEVEDNSFTFLISDSDYTSREFEVSSYGDDDREQTCPYELSILPECECNVEEADSFKAKQGCNTYEQETSAKSDIQLNENAEERADEEECDGYTPCMCTASQILGAMSSDFSDDDVQENSLASEVSSGEASDSKDSCLVCKNYEGAENDFNEDTTEQAFYSTEDDSVWNSGSEKNKLTNIDVDDELCSDYCSSDANSEEGLIFGLPFHEIANLDKDSCGCDARKKRVYGVYLEDDITESVGDISESQSKKIKLEPPTQNNSTLKSVIKEVGKACFYMAGTIAALAYYGSKLDANANELVG